jgi:hypothetical protein
MRHPHRATANPTSSRPRPKGVDGRDRADEAIATGERAPDGDARRRRSDEGGR